MTNRIGRTVLTRYIMAGVVLLLSLPLATRAIAATNTKEDAELDSTPGGKLQPHLSASGLQRLKKNIETLTQNAKEVQSNIEIADRNLKTLQAELADISSLQKEHEDLQNQYQTYLADANKKLAKTETELQKIAKYERENAAAAKKSTSTKGDKIYDAEKLAEDKTSLLDWKADAVPKIRRVNELVGELKDNLIQIEEKKSQVKKDLSTWVEHRKEFEISLKQFNSKKAELQKLADRESD